MLPVIVSVAATLVHRAIGQRPVLAVDHDRPVPGGRAPDNRLVHFSVPAGAEKETPS